jgi:MYXO-CTERM domain-containing protein
MRPLAWFVLVNHQLPFTDQEPELERPMRHPVLAAAAFTGALLFSVGASASYATYFGEDPNDDEFVPLSSIPLSQGAEAAFKSQLTAGVYTENFEGQSAGAVAPLTLSFINSTTSATTYAPPGGGAGWVLSVGPATPDGAGRYSIPSASSSKFWLADAGGSFEIKFTSAVAAFGFYGIDIGDYGGTVSVSLLSQTGSVITSLPVPASVGFGGDTGGSVVYFGALSDGAASDFWGVRFSTTYGGGDVFGFDNFTIATRDQVVTPPTNPTPIPGTLLLAGLGLAGLGAMRRRAR